MAISSPGIGSGLDVNSIVSQLVALERRPLAQLRTAATFIETQISAFGRVQSLVSALRDAAQTLARPGLWTQTSAGSNQPAGFTASASAGAAPGAYELQVTQLARAQSLASAAFASGSAVVGAGRLTIERGHWSEADPATPGALPAFTPQASGAPVVLDFDDPATTLEAVRDRINAARAGVTASIVRDTSGARLTLRSDSTGTEHALRLRATALDGSALTGGLGALAYAPDADGSGGMQQTQAAANARATINGLAVESASNRFDNVIDRVSFTAVGVMASAGTLTVSNDSGAQRAAVQGFVAAYNALNSFLVEQTRFDETRRVGGTLQGDSTALSLRSQLRGLLRETGGSGLNFFELLSRRGDAPRDGTLTLDTARLDAALANPGTLGRLFSGDGADVAGIATRFRQAGDRLLGADGALSNRREGLNSRLRRNQDEQERVNDRVERTRVRLLQQYQSLDVRLGQMTSLSNLVGQQMTMLNNQLTSSRNR